MKAMQDLIRETNLTKTQKVIANYILDNMMEACFMTSTEIALALDVSESSVIRFSRALGFDGFMDFQKFMRKGYNAKVSNISSNITIPSERMSQQVDLGTPAQHIESHFKNALKNLDSVFLENSIEAFEAAADAIIASNRKYVAATRGNTCLGDYFMLYMKQMLPGVAMTNSTSLSPFDNMCNVDKNDCLIMFSFPRYSSIDEITAQMAEEAGAKIIVITDRPSAELAKYATHLLTVPVTCNTFFNSMVGPQFVTEALLDTISHKVSGIEDRLTKIDKYLDKLGNY